MARPTRDPDTAATFPCHSTSATCSTSLSHSPTCDSADLETNYSTHGFSDPDALKPDYFPSARATTDIKLAAGLGLPARLQTDFAHDRPEIVAHGLNNTGLYRTLVADAFASGGIFYVEERTHNIHTDFAAIAPWYRFVHDHPELFNGIPQALTRVAVLQLWEQYEQFPKPALSGTVELLADEGWQHDVLFSGEDTGEDTSFDYPGVSRPLTLQRLRQYPVVILPVITESCTCNVSARHAQLLMDYVDGGGRLIVFASDLAIEGLFFHARNRTSAAFFDRLRSAPAQAGAGNLVRIRDSWPTTYQQTMSPALRANLTSLLESLGVDRPLRLEGARLAVAAFARGNAQRLVVHLVNYDYDRPSDHITPVPGLMVSIAGVPADAVITAYAPDDPGGTRLAFEVSNGRARITVPRIEPWTVLSITFPNPAGPALAAAVLPGSRAVQVGASATVFATLIATGTGTATGCSVAPFGGMATDFLYQSTNPVTNELTGAPNTPVDIPAGSLRTFLIAFTPTAPFSPRDVQLSFHCANAIDAPVISGVNTLLLNANATATPDIVALGATPSNDGVVRIPGTNGTGVFAIATSNVGAGGTIIVSADTGGATVPVRVSLCQTVPATGACVAPPASTVATQVNPGQTPTFTVFIQALGAVPFDPAVNRVVVTFKTADGTTVGSTSAALSTQ
jgi:hypothetical protein